MIVDILEVGNYFVNCYLVGCDKTHKGIIIDPGENEGLIISKIKENNLEMEKIVITHGHLDHIGALEYIKNKLNIPVCIHKDDADMLISSEKNLSAMTSLPIEASPADIFLEEEQYVQFGETKLKVLHTPGHSPGGISLYGEGVVFTGDTLFLGSVGRTDLPGGNFEILMKSINEKLFTLPDDTLVYSGHGPDTTIAQEKQYNPFVE